MSKENTKNNRELYRSLLEQAGISQRVSADLLTEQTDRSCSVRSVRSWLADPSLSSARPCPDWAVDNLILVLKRKGLIP